MAVARSSPHCARLVLLVLPLALGACDTHFIDVIGRTDDPCAALNADQCAVDTQDGCSLEPNPTGCLSTDPRCGAGVCAGGDPFVRRSGEALFLHGAPFSFLGTVSWGIAWADGGCQIGLYASQQDALGPVFDELATMHVSVLRFWAFQAYAGDGGTDYSHFDRVVARARAAGIRLLPVLENMRTDCSSGDARDDTWFATGYQSPYGSYALSYRDYVAGLVTYFRDEPTIMGWELMHEAGGTQFAALDGFAGDMTTLIRSTDPNHLIALGLNDGDTPATSSDGNPSNYFQLQNRAEVDLIDVHDFSTPDQPLPSQLSVCQGISQALDKVIFVGSSGVELVDTSAASFALRAGQITQKIEAAQAHDFRGFLIYDYVPAWPAPYYDFDSRSAEPLAGANGVLAQHAPTY